jgi:hypothetical protein
VWHLWVSKPTPLRSGCLIPRKTTHAKSHNCHTGERGSPSHIIHLPKTRTPSPPQTRSIAPKPGTPIAKLTPMKSAYSLLIAPAIFLLLAGTFFTAFSTPEESHRLLAADPVAIAQIPNTDFNFELTDPGSEEKCVDDLVRQVIDQGPLRDQGLQVNWKRKSLTSRVTAWMDGVGATYRFTAFDATQREKYQGDITIWRPHTGEKLICQLHPCRGTVFRIWRDGADQLTQQVQATDPCSHGGAPPGGVLHFR